MLIVNFITMNKSSAPEHNHKSQTYTLLQYYSGENYKFHRKTINTSSGVRGGSPHNPPKKHGLRLVSDSLAFAMKLHKAHKVVFLMLPLILLVSYTILNKSRVYAKIWGIYYLSSSLECRFLN